MKVKIANMKKEFNLNYGVVFKSWFSMDKYWINWTQELAKEAEFIINQGDK